MAAWHELPPARCFPSFDALRDAHAEYPTDPFREGYHCTPEQEEAERLAWDAERLFTHANVRER